MFYFAPFYKLSENIPEGKKYSVNVDIKFDTGKGEILHIDTINLFDKICVNEEDLDELKAFTEYYKNNGKFICEIRDDEFHTHIKGQLFATFYTHKELELSKVDEYAQGETLIAKELYSYSTPNSEEFSGNSIGYKRYECNELWRKRCLNIFKNAHKKDSNYKINEYTY